MVETNVPARRHRKTLVASLAALWLASLAIVIVRTPAGFAVSADPGAATLPIWAVVLPPAAAIAMMAVLRKRITQPIEVVHPTRVRWSTGMLLALAIAFPGLCIALQVSGEDYILAKCIMLMVVPAIVLSMWRSSLRIVAPRTSWRWWIPAIVIVAWTLLSQVAPWNPRFDAAGIDPVFLIVAALATAITAGVGEELFFRRWLQSRLEAIGSRWLGIGIASLAFALMHLATHGTGDVVYDVAKAIVAQGSFGVMLGMMWSYYRNLTAIIVTHLIANGWGVAVALLAM